MMVSFRDGSLVQRELAPKVTEGLLFEIFIYNPSASHLLSTSLYTREAFM